MARSWGKSSKGFGGKGARSAGNPRQTRSFGPPRGPGPDSESVLSALAKLPAGATASQLAAAMSRQADSRDIGMSLRRLVEQGKVLEVRPGRYQVSGTGGEFSALIQTGATEADLQAQLPDGRVMPVHPSYALGARARRRRPDRPRRGP
jgi:hypothetical protein